jgi:2-keto-4-pentenoate hydratase
MMESWQTSDTQTLVANLLTARATGERLAWAELPVPPDIDAAMAVQAGVARGLSVPIRGWKVGRDPSGTPVAAPLHPFIEANSDGRADVDANSALGLEVELAFRLAADLYRPDQPWTREDILRRIEGVYLGLELIGARLIEGGNAPFPLFLADGLANSGYILGPRLPPYISERVHAGNVPVRVTGGARWDGMIGQARTDPLEPLIASANAQSDRLGGLKAGQFISTGALCGLVAITSRGPVDVEFDGALRMRINVDSRSTL